MKKILAIFLSVILFIGCFIGFTYVDSYYIAPTNFKVTYLDIKDKNVPDNFNNFKILFFSDLSYGNYFGQDRLEVLLENINSLEYDMVIFGGDVIDNNYSSISNDVVLLTKFFSKIEAKYGKFAILSEYDLASDGRKSLVTKILKDSGFELINSSFPVYKEHSSQYIYLLDDSFASISSLDKHFSITITSDHSFTSQSNLILCGNTHDYQINKPFEKHDYKLGKQNNTYVARGVGMSNYNYRLFNNPELLIIKLSNEN